jgi:hypothetical protein
MHIGEVVNKDIQRQSGYDIITSILPHQGRRFYDYWATPLHCCLIIQHASPKIVDALLALIVRR